jgi:transposase
MADKPPTSLSLKEAAKHFDVDVPTIKRWVAKGRLRTVECADSSGEELRVEAISSPRKIAGDVIYL